MNDIISDLTKEQEENAYYWDSMNDVAYHVHVLMDGIPVCMKAENKLIQVISDAEFIEAVNNKCYGNSISENNYYGSIK